MELRIVEYKGVICTQSAKMPEEAKRAFSVYLSQVARCTNPKNKDYPKYGGRGIRVCYSPRKFIAWYLNHLKHFKGTSPTVGRIDHSKHYSFENIEMISNSANVLERLARCGLPNPSLPVLAYKNSGEFFGRFGTAVEAEKAMGIKTGTITTSCRNKAERGRSGFYFRYA